MAEAKYLFARKNGIVFFKMSGALKYTVSIGFDQFLDQMIETDDFTDVVFDLTDAEYLDSTNLGLIAKVAEHMLEKHNKKATILSPNADINEILESVGFDDFFIIISSVDQSFENLEEIPIQTKDDLETAKVILKAHKTLMAVNENNKKVFEDIVHLIEGDISKREEEQQD